ncbi:MAG: response regulator [Eubacteriales bacterium]
MMQKTAHILICDDQPIIHESLGVYLENEGFTHASAFNGVQAVKMAETESPDLILMDLMMPEKKTAWTPAARLGKKSSVPDHYAHRKRRGDRTKRRPRDRCGHYIVKPFSARELIARIKAVLRRISAEPETEGKTIRMEDLEISLNNYEVKSCGKTRGLHAQRG